MPGLVSLAVFILHCEHFWWLTYYGYNKDFISMMLIHGTGGGGGGDNGCFLLHKLFIVIKKVKLSLCFFFTEHHAMKVHWRVESAFFDLSTRWR
jgi:hypothetical protein